MLEGDKRFSSDLRFNSVMHVSAMVAIGIIVFLSIVAVLLSRTHFWGESIFVWMRGAVVLVLIGVPVFVWRVTGRSERDVRQVWCDVPPGVYKELVRHYPWFVVVLIVMAAALIGVVGTQ
ncbi:MAG: hypothetical protein ACK4SX_01025 [Alcanivoracaceae bacterium]